MKKLLEVDRRSPGPKPLATVGAAANEEFTAAVRPSTGWDPYEVWRTRIKPALSRLSSGVVPG